MSFWPVGPPRLYVRGDGRGGGAGLGVGVQEGRAAAVAAGTALEHVVWERDRVLALAKGTATSAIGS